MGNTHKNSEHKTKTLKDARLQLLKLHKLLVDIERQKYESQNGPVSSGQFLQILLNDTNFSWLRKFSTLIVEIDEMLDLSDGFSEEMIDRHVFQIQNLLAFESDDKDFNSKYQNLLQSETAVESLHNQVKETLLQE